MKLTRLDDHPVERLAVLIGVFDDVSPDAPTSQVRAMLDARSSSHGELDEMSVAELRALVLELRQVFCVDGEQRRSVLNEMLAVTPVELFMTTAGRLSGRAHDDRRGLPQVRAELLVALAQAVTDFGDRLGACPARGCLNVFVDRTRNRSQRYCSTTCLNRDYAHHARHGRDADGGP